jgi:predicted transglutaminase-like cysteine proteinase
MSSTIRITMGGALVALVMFGTPAEAEQAAAPAPVDFTNVAFAPTTGDTSIPVGAEDFCRRYPTDCAANARVIKAEHLTSASWNELVAVNTNVNTTIIPETDEANYHVAEYWTYPTDGRGDCEDYALEKRKELIAAGWDASALLMTVVREKSGDGHAVLMVRTDRGDLILDNQDARVLLWKDTPYDYIKRQSQADPGKWVGLNDNRFPVAVTASN